MVGITGKLLLRNFVVISLSAIMVVIAYANENQGKKKVKQTNGIPYSYSMNVDTTELLITFDITDCRLDLACGQMPDYKQEDIVLCVAAAFTGKCLDHFTHTNILGKHISNGVLYNGYEENTGGFPYHQRYALFVWQGYDEKGNMLEKGFYTLPNDTLLMQTTNCGGMAFTQHWVIQDGHIYTPTIQPLERVEHFRAICQKEKRLYVIANRDEMTYQSFLLALQKFGVENALYLDMGVGWNHSFYRDTDNQLHILHPKVHHFPTNWLVVYK